MAWWLLWWLFVLVLLLIPLGYGWGYQGWGAPYPYPYRRRQQAHSVVAGAPPQEEGEARTWGVVADALWIVFVVALVWLLV